MRFFISVLFLMSSLFTFAQESTNLDGQFNSDRPGFSYSAQVLEQGKLILQSGFFYNLPNSQVFSTFQNPNGVKVTGSAYSTDHFFRYGLLERIELGVGIAYNRSILTSTQSSLSSNSENLNIPTVIVRGQLVEETGKLPAVNLQYQLDVNQNIDPDSEITPSTDRTSTSHQLRISIAKSFNSIGLASNINLPLDGGSVSYTLNLGYSFIRGGAFVEAFGSFDKGTTESLKQAPIINLNTGVWYPISRVVRLDLGFGRFAGFGANYFAAVGATFNLN